jgi:hypothetical protein
MRYIKTYNNFKHQKLNEGIVFNILTIQNIVKPQTLEALKSLSVDATPQDVITWIKSTILNTKSDTFLVKKMIEELRVNGGVGGSFLPKGYHGMASAVDATQFDYADTTYYKFMQGVFDPEFGVFSDQDDIKNRTVNFTGQKNDPTHCGLFFIQQLFQKKFGNNKVPYAVVEYCIKQIRKSVAQKIKYIQESKRPEFIDEFQPRIGGETKIEVEDEKIPPGCFKEEAANTCVPELKQILVKCGGRDLYKNGMSPADESKILKPIAQKKRLAFYNYFTTQVYSQFKVALNELQNEDVTKYLEESGINAQSGKQTYKVGDEVVYLRKDKTMDDWNGLKDFQQDKLDEEPASKIVGVGNITELEGDNIKIEYKSGEFVDKVSDDIIRKIKKSEEPEPEEKSEEKTGEKTDEEEKEVQSEK